MRGEAVFLFKCGTDAQASQIEDWLECENWPDELRAILEEKWEDIDDLAAIVSQADADRSSVLVQATGSSDLEVMVDVLDYAMQSWDSVPSPQGFSFGLALEPALDDENYEIIDFGKYDGGAVVLRRGAEPEIVQGSAWLDAVLHE